MGNHKTKLGTQIAQSMSFYEYLKDIDDYRFGRAQLWVKKGTRQTDFPEFAVVKEKWSMTMQDFARYTSYINARRAIRSPYLCDVIGTEEVTDSSWCSKYYKSHVAMEFSEESLAEELLRRRRLTRDDPGKWMGEPEMWYLLRAIAEGCEMLYRHNILHGDIQPRHILIFGDGHLKLFEAPLLSQYFTGGNRMLQEGDYHAALSPHELDVMRNDLLYRTMNPGVAIGTPGIGVPGIHNKSHFPRTNKLDSDSRLPDGDLEKHSHLMHKFPDFETRHVHSIEDEVYSIGITALCAACNNPITDFYDYNTVQVNRERINQKLGFLRELGYSGQLIGLIQGMLHDNPAQRATIGQILQTVSTPHTLVQPLTGTPMPGHNPGLPGGPGHHMGSLATSTMVPPMNPGMSGFTQGAPPLGAPGSPAAPVRGPGGPGPVNPGMNQFNSPAGVGVPPGRAGAPPTYVR